MYLTKLADLLVEAINTSSPGNWVGGIVLPVDLPAIAGFDPFTATDTLDPGVFIVPGYNEFDLSQSRRTDVIDLETGTRQRTSISPIKRVSVIICKAFEAKLELSSRGDASEITELSLLSNLREDLETFLIHCSISGVKLVDIEPLPPDELAFDNRIYLAATNLGFKTC